MIHSYFKQMFAGLIDAGISIFLYSLIILFFPRTFKLELEATIWVAVLILAIFSLYRLVTLLILNGTIGMLLFRLRLLNADKEPLSAREKLFASFFILINGVSYHEKK